MAERRRVALRTLGCKVNQAESEALAAELTAAGVEVTAGAAADVVVVNTCTVTAEADRKVRKAARAALAANPRALVLLIGCAAVVGDGLGDLGPRVRVEPDRERVAERVAELAGVAPRGDTPAGAASRGDAPAVRTPGARTRSPLKVQEGCEAGCAYCIVPAARGVPRSTAFGDVVARARALAEAGVAEVVLTGTNVGTYADAGRDLADLVTAVAEAGVRRIRLSSIEPEHLTPRLLEVLAATPAFAPHLHVPLQSGSDRVLAAMRRPYDTERLAEVAAAARAALPGLALTTDVIAGFPGETAEDAEVTLRFVRAAGFVRLHVFRFSARRGTPAADMPGQVPPAERAARAAALRALDAELRAAHAAWRVGGEAEVLAERVAGAWAVGTSEDYLRVRFRHRGCSVGDLARVRLERAADGGVEGAAR